MRNIESSMLGIYSIKDKHAGMYLPPFLCSCDDDAKRIVGDSIEPGSVLGRYPADFLLVRCGIFDSKLGFICDAEEYIPEVLCSITDIVRASVIEESIAMEALKDE